MITSSVEFRSESPPSHHGLRTTTLASHDRRLLSLRQNWPPPAHVGDQDCVQQYQTPDAVTIGDHGTAVQRRHDGDLLAVHHASDRHGQLDPEPPQPGCRRPRLLPQRAVAAAPKLSGDDIKKGHGAVSLRHLFRLLCFTRHLLSNSRGLKRQAWTRPTAPPVTTSEELDRGSDLAEWI